MSEKIKRKKVGDLGENIVFRTNFGLPGEGNKPVDLFFAPIPRETNGGRILIVSVQQVVNEQKGYSSRVTAYLDPDALVEVMTDRNVVGILTRSRKRSEVKGFGFVPRPDDKK
ncbi:MAG: hypothetical protein HQK53_17250 [Oligoflexia bacterium]|nr:hypothetical protein [Oligoflexia bacterium]